MAKRVFSLLICSTLFFSSCFNTHESTGHSRTFEDIEKLQKEIAEEILHYLGGNDNEAFSNMFCEYSRELSDFEEQIQVVMSFFESGILSYNEEERISGGTSMGRIHGEIDLYRSMGRIENILTTDGESYTISFYNYLVSEEEKRVGIYRFVVREKVNENIEDDEIFIIDTPPIMK